MASHQQLSQLVVVIDYNKIQSFGRVEEVVGLEPLTDKWQAFGWRVLAIDGHDPMALRVALDRVGQGDKPTAIIAHTIKGKGVSFMEDRLAWHYKSPNPDQFQAALRELESPHPTTNNSNTRGVVL